MASRRYAITSGAVCYPRPSVRKLRRRVVRYGRYGQDELRRLRFIRSAQAAGFTLEEISELLELDATDDRKRARQLAKQRIAALDQKVAEMQLARAALAHLVDLCDHGTSGPCPIIAAFERQ